jgi:hypothetical protein
MVQRIGRFLLEGVVSQALFTVSARGLCDVWRVVTCVSP